MPLAVASVVAQQALGQATPLGSDAPGLVGQRFRQRAETSATGKPTPRMEDGLKVGWRSSENTWYCSSLGLK
jgi:hypothetical protein